MPNMTKDPDAMLDYRWDWTEWLQEGESISVSEVLVPTGIVLVSDTNTTATVTAWLSGGTVDQVYEVTNRVTTNQNRVDDRTIFVRVAQR